jgi:hypothetical protein
VFSSGDYTQIPRGFSIVFSSGDYTLVHPTQNAQIPRGRKRLPHQESRADRHKSMDLRPAAQIVTDSSLCPRGTGGGGGVSE